MNSFASNHQKKNSPPWSGSEVETHRLTLPAQFRMLCALLNVDPDRVLYDFMATVGAESYGLGTEPQETAANYLLQAGYGQDYYTREDIQRIIRELAAISALWPKGASTEMITVHSNWRNRYYEYWYKKWYYKMRRKRGSHLKRPESGV